MSDEINVCVTSDFHGRIPPVASIPECDLLILAGDLQGVSRKWLLAVQKLRGCRIVSVAGNHDPDVEHDPSRYRALPWLYLQDECAVVGGWKVYGSPWSVKFAGSSFQKPDDELAEIWRAIPEDTEILITHGPAFMSRDRLGGQHVGSLSLALRIRELYNLRLHAFGHIHEDYGFEGTLLGGKDATRYWGQPYRVNGSHVGTWATGPNPPICFTLTKGTIDQGATWSSTSPERTLT